MLKAQLSDRQTKLGLLTLFRVLAIFKVTKTFVYPFTIKFTLSSHIF
jgi:hypothetical protein